METTTEEEFCFPHLNSSCRRPSAHTQSQAAVIYTLLSLTALITTVLNLLVIIAIAHFRHRTKLDIQKQIEAKGVYYAVERFIQNIKIRNRGDITPMEANATGLKLNQRNPYFLTLSQMQQASLVLLFHCGQLHSSTNFILLSLAVSDFFVGIVVIPVESHMSRTCWALGDLMCVIYFIVPSP
ncbi:hypothetical protein WMY93_003379 [Mugilogobius chulae]|uniref:G-protein coupled receptors family 1 profile domain-containing protein n=1 Tax=Mugilogobius chulae TaxID=88201 RepID=A0AAW0PW17_9GOBI